MLLKLFPRKFSIPSSHSTLGSSKTFPSQATCIFARYGTFNSSQIWPLEEKKLFQYKLKPNRKPQTVLLPAKEVLAPMLCENFRLIFTRTPGKREEEEEGEEAENVSES